MMELILSFISTSLRGDWIFKMTTQLKSNVSLVTHSETDDQGDYHSADSGEFEPGPPLRIEDGPLTGANTPQNLSVITGAHTSNPQSRHQEVDRLNLEPLIIDTEGLFTRYSEGLK